MEFGGHNELIAQCEGKLRVRKRVKVGPSHPELTSCRSLGLTEPFDKSVVLRPEVALTRALRGSP